jgi:prephenate dehydrogenase
MYKFFEEFLKKMASSFRRIAKATKHEVTEEDLKNDAWVIAHDIGARRGQAINFADSADQDLVIRAVNVKM